MSPSIRILFPACALSLALSTLLGGCSKPKPPEHDQQPKPQSAADAATPATPPPTPLREAIQQPLDEAKAAKQATEDAGQDQRKAIDDATGG